MFAHTFKVYSLEGILVIFRRTVQLYYYSLYVNPLLPPAPQSDPVPYILKYIFKQETILLNVMAVKIASCVTPHMHKGF